MTPEDGKYALYFFAFIGLVGTVVLHLTGFSEKEWAGFAAGYFMLLVNIWALARITNSMVTLSKSGDMERVAQAKKIGAVLALFKFAFLFGGLFFCLVVIELPPLFFSAGALLALSLFVIKAFLGYQKAAHNNL